MWNLKIFIQEKCLWKCHLQKWRPSCVCLNVLKHCGLYPQNKWELFAKIWGPQHDSGSCLTPAIWCCCKPFSQWQHSFQRKLCSHWLKFLQQRHVPVVRQGPCLSLYRRLAKLSTPITSQTTLDSCLQSLFSAQRETPPLIRLMPQMLWWVGHEQQIQWSAIVTYNAVQCIKNGMTICESQKAPHISPSWVNYGMPIFWGFWRKSTVPLWAL